MKLFKTMVLVALVLLSTQNVFGMIQKETTCDALKQKLAGAFEAKGQEGRVNGDEHIYAPIADCCLFDVLDLPPETYKTIGNPDRREHYSTVLFCSALLGNYEHVQILLEKSPTPNTTFVHGHTPLHAVAQIYRIVRTSEGPLSEAERLRITKKLSGAYENIAQRLCAAGANINAVTAAGLTPFHIAVINTQIMDAKAVGLVDIFFENPNLDTTIETNSGKSAGSFALEKLRDQKSPEATKYYKELASKIITKKIAQLYAMIMSSNSTLTHGPMTVVIGYLMNEAIVDRDFLGTMVWQLNDKKSE